MLALLVFQMLLNAIGAVLAWVFDLVGNYGVAIIVLTVAIKLILLPLGIKQIKSMQAMQAIQPRVKEIQKKFKGNKQRVQEETMKLYKDVGVNPLGGCLPLLLQFPILIAMYAVIRAPVPNASPPPAYLNNHLPVESQLYQNVTLHQGTDFLGLNLQCTASESGTPRVPVLNSERKPSGQTLDCGSTPAAKIPYFALLAIMVATTYYQQRQMQQASPPGAASSQQQAILRIMPIMFGIFGFTFPAGLTLYWTTSNLWQIGQQYALLRAGHIGPAALERRMAEQRDPGTKPARMGFMARLQARAEEERRRREQATRKGDPSRSGRRKPGPAPGSTKRTGRDSPPSRGSQSRGSQAKRRRPNTGHERGRRPPGAKDGSEPRDDGAGDGETSS